jgi:hypothetical protein
VLLASARGRDHRSVAEAMAAERVPKPKVAGSGPVVRFGKPVEDAGSPRDDSRRPTVQVARVRSSNYFAHSGAPSFSPVTLFLAASDLSAAESFFLAATTCCSLIEMNCS